MSQYDLGGKGSSLVKLQEHNYNVPKFFVLDTRFFDEFLEENNIKDKIDDLLDELNLDNFIEISKKIRSLFKDTKVTSSIKEYVNENIKTLDTTNYAVRSSANIEDSKDNSWAGLFDSFLNVTRSDVEAKIIACMESCFSARVLIYKLKNNITVPIKMAVIIQDMVVSDCYGTLFTKDPITGEDVIQIDVGLNIVTHYEIKDNILYDANGNVLDDKVFLELGRISKTIEELYKTAADIEWIIDDKGIHLIQARPITTINNSITKIVEYAKSVKWNFHVTRLVLYFVKYSNVVLARTRNNIRDVLGFELKPDNMLMLNGKEYHETTTKDEINNFFDKMFKEDNQFFEKYADHEVKLAELIEEYIKDLSNRKDSLSVVEEFERFKANFIKTGAPFSLIPDDYLEIKTKEILERVVNDNEDINTIFNILSTCPDPEKIFYNEEPLDLLRVAKKIKENPQAREELINKHIDTYAWMKGPILIEEQAFTYKDYEDRINYLITTDIDRKIEDILKARSEREKEVSKLIEKYPFTDDDKSMIHSMRRFVFLRTFMATVQDRLFFLGRHGLFEQISKEYNIPKKELLMLTADEISEFLKNPNTEEYIKLAHDREKEYSIITIDEKVTSFAGDEAQKIDNILTRYIKVEKREEKEQKVESSDKTVTGMIANLGCITGRAKILNSYEDISNVNIGDIIVSTMTLPNYIAAMEKARGFITDEGGITCHAAILSREFNVPCIVGTINATKVIKDNDLIELDANNGIVRIIERDNE